MFRTPRAVLAALMLLAASCSLIYDVDSITSSGPCGEENAKCCAGNNCNAALNCDPDTSQCKRCPAKDTVPCCLSKNLADCVVDGAASKLAGECNGGSCEVPCTSSPTECSVFPQSLCCDNVDEVPGCKTCGGTSCVCRICCGKCKGGSYQTIKVAEGTNCIDATTAVCASLNQTYDDSRWDPVGC